MVVKPEIVDFFKNFFISRDCITSRVGKVLVVFDSSTLSYVLGISCVGFAFCPKNKWSDLLLPLKPLEIVRKFFGNPSRSSESKVYKKFMSPYHKFLFAFVIKKSNAS